MNRYNPLMTENQKIDHHILTKYKIIKKLGSGAYGHVWKVSPQDKPGKIFALKKVFEAFQHDTDAQRTYRQISILKKLDHDNIIKLYEVLPSVSGRDIYLVFEFMNTDLYKAIYQNNLQEVHKRYIMYQMLKGLHYLHSANILHRDLKPSNLLLSTQCDLKICDFGLARHLENQEEESVLTEGVATRWYRAPEVLLGSNRYGQMADMWSVGCIFAQILMKNPLFNCNSILSHFEKIIQTVGRPTVQSIKQIGQTASTLYRQCGQVRQKSLKQLFGSLTDESGLDLLNKLLKFEPQRRMTARQALQHPYFRQFYREQELKEYKGHIRMETDDNIKLNTSAYRQLIQKYFISPQERQPQRFGDLRREKSFGRILEDIHSRKSSCERESSKSQKKNNSLFEQLIKQRNNSNSSKTSSMSKQSRTRSSGGSAFNERDKQNLNMNRGPLLQKFNQKAPGTFAALRKVTVSRFNR